MQREQILYELQCLFWPARAKLIIYVADSLLTFHVSSLHPVNKRASILQLHFFHCLSFSIFSRGFERRRTCLCCYICAPFLPFSSNKFLHLFTFALPFFSDSFCSFFPFFKVLFLYPIFTRTFVITLNIFFLYASIDATIRLSLSVFIRHNPRPISGFLQLIYLLTPPE